MTSTETRAPDPTTPLEWALAYAAHGWRVFPLWPVVDGQCTCFRGAKCSDAGKHPLPRNGLHAATTDGDSIQRWWRSSNCGIGLATGEASGVWVVDVDQKGDGALAWTELLAHHNDMRPPSNVWSTTGGGGEHWFFEWDSKEPVRNSASKIATGIDVRGEGGFVVLPPSIHRSGRAYEWGLCVDLDGPRCMSPQWLYHKAVGKTEVTPLIAAPVVSNPTAYAMSGLERECAHIRNAAEGTRNETLNSAAFSVGRFVADGSLDRVTVVAGLSNAAAIAGLSTGEALKTITSGLGAHPAPADGAGPHEPATTADGMIVLDNVAPMRVAESWLKTQRDDRGRLMLRRWREDFWKFDGSCYRLASEETTDTLLWQHMDQVWHRYNEDGEIRKHDPGIQRVAGVRKAVSACGAMIDDNSDAPFWVCGGEGMDLGRIVTCRNGIVDLETGTLRPATPNLFSTNALDFDYDPGAKVSSAWLDFVGEAWPDDADAVNMLQEWFGYCLTHDVSQQKMLLLLGPPRSGKGTIGRVMADLIGHANRCGPTLAGMSDRFGASPLLGKQLAIVSDARVSKKADQNRVVELLLAITGVDAISVERKFREAVDTTLGTRIMIMANEAPVLGESSGALAGRFIILRMRKSHLGSEDLGLHRRLVSSMPGLLNWAIAGWHRLYERGAFQEPESSSEDRQSLRRDMAPVAAFVEDTCNTEPKEWVESALLYEKYLDWCKAEGRSHPGTAASFGRRLRSAFPALERKREGTGDRRWLYHGINYKGQH